MNNLITNEYLQQFRLRSARQKKRMQYEDFEKWLRKLDKEENELYWQRRSLAWTELDPPIVRGWKRYFVLRDDVARSKNKVFFEKLLQKINTIDYSTRKDFKKKKRKFGKKIYVVKPQYLLALDRQYIVKHKFTEKELSFFEEKEVLDKRSKKPVKKYVFAEPWRFVLRIRPNLITKVQIKNIELEQRLSYIHNYIEQNHLRPSMHRLKYGNYKWRYAEGEKAKERNPYKHKSLIQILNICNQKND